MGEKLGRRADANAKGAWTEMPVFGRVARRGAEVLGNHQGTKGTKERQIKCLGEGGFGTQGQGSGKRLRCSVTSGRSGMRHSD
jgi:hypothetical protein